jgi:dipeptide/tripeptide permease
MLFKTLKTFPKTFWVANTIELFERWAWYGFFMLFAIYLTDSSDAGGLEFTQTQKGMIMGIGTAILYFLPVITGAIADKYGYKRILAISFVIYASAFVLLPQFDSFTGVFIMYLYLAIGAALFKPIVSATVAKTTNDDNASIGFGIFYMMVNIGAFLGPLLSLLYRSNVFYISAAMILLNFILLLFYKEPDRQNQDKSSLKEAITVVFRNIFVVLSDFKFVIFLLIISGFWTMYNQLFYTLPVFIQQWSDTAVIYNFFQEYWPFIAKHYGDAGQIHAGFITNFDAMFIILFQLIVSTLVMRLKPLHSMISGIIVASIGMSLTLLTQNVMFTIAAMLIFAIGEMAASPKITEYIGRNVAPKDKKALYIGYSFFPLFFGNFFSGIISGQVYQAMSDKNEMVANLAKVKGLTFNESMSLNDKFESLASYMQLTSEGLTQYLWEHNNPSSIWLVILSIGLFSALSLAIYNRFVSRT